MGFGASSSPIGFGSSFDFVTSSYSNLCVCVFFNFLIFFQNLEPLVQILSN
jgi:hypothetical protein